MKQISRSLIVTFLCVTLSLTALAQRTWTFSVLVAVEPQTATYYEQTYHKPIGQIVREQMATINANFNLGTGFSATYNFRVDSVYVITRPVSEEVFAPHPGFRYKIVINGFFDPGTDVGGGWYGNVQTVYHSWRWDGWGGPFGGYATDGLTHELGHARGGIDLYALRVDATSNSINRQAFEPVNSIMNYPYGNIVWDEYTTHLLNSTADGAIVGDAWITQPFPKTIAIQTLDQQGQPLAGASVTLYPVNWFSYAVSATPVLQTYTDVNGVYAFASNPFGVPTLTSPWHIHYPNFLVKATYNGVVTYRWLPLYEVQNAYFRYGPDAAFNVAIQLPTVPAIRLTSLSSTTFCPDGGEVNVGLAVPISVNPDNVFKLLLSDAGSNFDYGSAIATLPGPLTSLSGWTGSLTAGGNYRIRVIGTSPAVESGTLMLTVKPKPNPPAVSSGSVCQNDPPVTLQATGQNLRWYTSFSGEGQTTVAPTVSTAQTGSFIYHVTQTIDGCESSMTGLTINVRAIQSVQSGSWSDPATWSCNRVPIAVDEPIISSYTQVSVPGSLLLPKRLTIQRWATLQFVPNSPAIPPK